MKYFNLSLFLLLISTLSTFPLHAQTEIEYQYKAVYGLEFNKNKNMTPPYGALEADAVIEKVPLVLLFNQNFSTFYVDYSFDQSDLGESLAYITINASSQYFSKKSDQFQTWWLKTKNQSKILIEDEKNIDWKIDKSKSIQINDLECYHATGELRSIYYGDHIVEAWYAPSIPFPFGPIGAGGLDGLIVKLKFLNKRLKLKSIVLENNTDKWIVESESIEMESYIQHLKKRG